MLNSVQNNDRFPTFAANHSAVNKGPAEVLINNIIDNAKELSLAIKIILMHVSLQPSYRQAINMQYEQIWDKLEQIHKQFVPLSETYDNKQLHHHLIPEYDAIIASLNDILPALKKIPLPIFESEFNFFKAQEDTPFVKMCASIEQANSLLASSLFEAGRNIYRLHENNFETFKLSYDQFLIVVTELKNRMIAASNYLTSPATPSAQTMAIEEITTSKSTLAPNAAAFSTLMQFETLYQNIIQRLKRINPDNFKRISQQELANLMKELKELIKLLADKSSDLQNFENKLTQGECSQDQLYTTLSDLVHVNNIYPHQPRKKIHTIQSYPRLKEVTPRVEKIDPNPQVSNSIIEESENTPTLNSTAENLVPPDPNDIKLLSKAVKEFFNQLGSVDVTSQEFVQFLTDYIPDQTIAKAVTVSDPNNNPQQLAKATFDLQLAITAYHIFMCIDRTKQNPQSPLQSTIFDFFYLKETNYHFAEFKTLIKEVLDKHPLKLNMNILETIISDFLLEVSDKILIAAQNYLFENKLIAKIRPLYEPIPDSIHGYAITEAVATLYKDKLEFSTLFKMANLILTRLFSTAAPFISFDQLEQFLSKRQAIEAKKPKETVNGLSPLDQKIDDFFKDEHILSEDLVIKKLSKLIEEQTNYIVIQSKPQKISKVSKIPEDLSSEIKFIISVYLIFNILNEYMKNNCNIQVIKDNICNFSYFAPGKGYKSKVAELLNKLFDKYSNRYSIKKIPFHRFITTYFDDIVSAAQNCFFRGKLITVVRPIYDDIKHMHLNIPALLKDIIFEIEEQTFESEKKDAGKLFTYKNLYKVNNSLVEKLGPQAPLITWNQFKNTIENKKQTATENNGYNILTKRKGSNLDAYLDE